MMLSMVYEEGGKTVRIEVEQEVESEEIRGDDRVVRRVGVGGAPVSDVIDRIAGGMKAVLE